MMKKSFLFVIASLLLCTACSNVDSSSYSVNGTIDNIEDGKVFLVERTKKSIKPIVVAEADIVNGKFEIKGATDTPKLIYLAGNDTMPFYSFFIENACLEIEGDKNVAEDFIITGSVDNELFAKYKKDHKVLDDKESELSTKYDKARLNGDTAAEKLLDEQEEQLTNSMKMLASTFITDNPNSYVSPFILLKNTYYFDLDEILPLYEGMKDGAIITDDYKKLSKLIEKMKNVAVGADYIDFTMNDTAGNPVSLSSLVGKGYLLVDFWASWCQYCRVENPNVVAQYAKYHDKGFEVLGVSLDATKDAWQNAIAKDGLPWIHVSDLQRWDNAAADMYAVRSIPSNVLISPEGKIIAKNLTGSNLATKLEELYK